MRGMWRLVHAARASSAALLRHISHAMLPKLPPCCPALVQVTAEMKMGTGDEERTYNAVNPDLVLDANVERQWKQIGSDPTGLRLQVRFVKRTKGNHSAFQVMDVRATVPDSPALSADGASEKSAAASAAAAMAGAAS